MVSPADGVTRLPLATRTARLTGLLVMLSAVWWVITEGAADAWLIGFAAIVGATVVLARTGAVGGPRLRPFAVVRFVLFFVWESLVGGFDVAGRVLRPELRIQPAIQRHAWRLPPGGLRVLAIATLCLQPGTLAVGDDGHTIEIHVLDGSLDLARSLQRIESLLGGDGRGRLSGRRDPLVSLFLGSVLLVLAAALVGGLLGTLRGRLAADRMIAAQLLGTVGVAFLLILAEALAAPALRDVALVLAALAGVAILAFVRLHGGTDQP